MLISYYEMIDYGLVVVRNFPAKSNKRIRLAPNVSLVNQIEALGFGAVAADDKQEPVTPTLPTTNTPTTNTPTTNTPVQTTNPLPDILNIPDDIPIENIIREVNPTNGKNPETAAPPTTPEEIPTLPPPPDYPDPPLLPPIGSKSLQEWLDELIRILEIIAAILGYIGTIYNLYKAGWNTVSNYLKAQMVKLRAYQQYFKQIVQGLKNAELVAQDNAALTKAETAIEDILKQGDALIEQVTVETTGAAESATAAAAAAAAEAARIYTAKAAATLSAIAAAIATISALVPATQPPPPPPPQDDSKKLLVDSYANNFGIQWYDMRQAGDFVQKNGINWPYSLLKDKYITTKVLNATLLASDWNVINEMMELVRTTTKYYQQFFDNNTSLTTLMNAATNVSKLDDVPIRTKTIENIKTIYYSYRPAIIIQAQPQPRVPIDYSTAYGTLKAKIEATWGTLSYTTQSSTYANMDASQGKSLLTISVEYT